MTNNYVYLSYIKYQLTYIMDCMNEKNCNLYL